MPSDLTAAFARRRALLKIHAAQQASAAVFALDAEHGTLKAAFPLLLLVAAENVVLLPLLLMQIGIAYGQLPDRRGGVHNALVYALCAAHQIVQRTCRGVEPQAAVHGFSARRLGVAQNDVYAVGCLAAGEKLWPYRFSGYWRDVGTITSLWDANMDMLSPTLINLYDPDWPISARSPICPPHYTGEHAEIIHSIVTEGCEIDGHVENSVLSPSVKVQTGANVCYSVLMPGAVVESGATVEYAIIGENTVIHSGAHVGSAPDGSDDWGVATCGPKIEIGSGARVPAGAMIYTGEEV